MLFAFCGIGCSDSLIRIRRITQLSFDVFFTPLVDRTVESLLRAMQ